jgi:hypothetical protein
VAEWRRAWASSLGSREEEREWVLGGMVAVLQQIEGREGREKTPPVRGGRRIVGSGTKMSGSRGVHDDNLRKGKEGRALEAQIYRNYLQEKKELRKNI